MNSVLLLRIAAAISLLFTAGHSAGGLKLWSPMGPNAVLKTMTETHFQTMGVNRSYLDFFLGFGWTITVSGLLQSVLLWQMAEIARANGSAAVKPMIAAFALATLASGIIAWRFIFPVPALFCLVLFAPLALAFLPLSEIERLGTRSNEITEKSTLPQPLNMDPFKPSR